MKNDNKFTLHINKEVEEKINKGELGEKHAIKLDGEEITVISYELKPEDFVIKQ